MADEEITHIDETTDPVEPAPEPIAAVSNGDTASEEAAPAPAAPAADETKNWFIIHTYSGFEQKVADSLRSRAEAFGFADQIGQILIPDRRSCGTARRQESHQQADALSRLCAGGDGHERRTVARREEHAARHRIRGRRQQAGSADGRRGEFDPVPPADSAERPRPKMNFEKNENVRIIDGPFANFSGKVDEVNPERNTLRVLVTIFGRATPVELDFLQVEKDIEKWQKKLLAR